MRLRLLHVMLHSAHSHLRPRDWRLACSYSCCRSSCSRDCRRLWRSSCSCSSMVRLGAAAANTAQTHKHKSCVRPTIPPLPMCKNCNFMCVFITAVSLPITKLFAWEEKKRSLSTEILRFKNKNSRKAAKCSACGSDRCGPRAP
jgi:hypothetical protein